MRIPVDSIRESGMIRSVVPGTSDQAFRRDSITSPPPASRWSERSDAGSFLE